MYNTRATSSRNYAIMKMKTEKENQAFRNTGAKVWNELLDHIKTAPSNEVFKEKDKKNDFRRSILYSFSLAFRCFSFLLTF